MEGKTVSASSAIVDKVVQLSEKTKITAHPGDKWKAGYVTISRVVPTSRSGFRHVHISKKAFEKFTENIQNIDEAFKDKSSQYQLMLTRKQFVLTTRFEREGKETLYYVSFMHPVEEKEVLTGEEEMNHAKTINLSEQEFELLKSVQQSLLVVVRSKNSSVDNEESVMIDGFRWLNKVNGERSTKIFLTEHQCSKDAESHHGQADKELFSGEPMDDDFDYKTYYVIEPVQLQRPTKLELIEHVVYCLVKENLKKDNLDTETESPNPADVDKAWKDVSVSLLCALVRRVLTQLKYKNVYLANELVQVFLYVRGVERVKDLFVNHLYPGFGHLYPRLIDSCFCTVYQQIRNECNA